MHIVIAIPEYNFFLKKFINSTSVIRKTDIELLVCYT